MSYSISHEDFMEQFTATFPDVAVVLQHINFGGSMYVFFLRFDTRDHLAAHWDTIAHYIAFNFQSALESEFEIWNLYVFYQVVAPVDKALKYKIENDTVSSRKIVIEDMDMSPEAIITEHITNIDLDITVDQDSGEAFEKLPLISDAMGRSSELSRKKNRAEFDRVFEAIVKTLKDEI